MTHCYFRSRVACGWLLMFFSLARLMRTWGHEWRLQKVPRRERHANKNGHVIKRAPQDRSIHHKKNTYQDKRLVSCGVASSSIENSSSSRSTTMVPPSQKNKHFFHAAEQQHSSELSKSRQVGAPPNWFRNREISEYTTLDGGRHDANVRQKKTDTRDFIKIKEIEARCRCRCRRCRCTFFCCVCAVCCVVLQRCEIVRHGSVAETLKNNKITLGV